MCNRSVFEKKCCFCLSLENGVMAIAAFEFIFCIQYLCSYWNDGPLTRIVFIIGIIFSISLESCVFTVNQKLSCIEAKFCLIVFGSQIGKSFICNTLVHLYDCKMLCTCNIHHSRISESEWYK